MTFHKGDRRFDVHDLDKWLDSFKRGHDDADTIVARLAAVTIVRVKGLARAGSANRASRRAARPVRPATETQGQLERQGVKLRIG